VNDEYLFGHSDLAARRLAVLAGAFAPSSRAFLAQRVGRSAGLAVDLGCGPGRTTHLLADVLGCERVIGLDNSQHFIVLAEKTSTATISFRLHDVTTVPFPDRPSDVIYARFLLTHMTDPEALVVKWTDQLEARGVLVLEETEAISTTVPAFAEYLAIVEAALGSRGHDLYVGKRLAGVPMPDMASMIETSTDHVPMTNDRVAEMFSMNIETWKSDAFVTENCSAQSIRRLQDALTDLAATPTDERGIEWELRRLVVTHEDDFPTL